MDKKRYFTPVITTIAIETNMLIAASGAAINTSGPNPTITVSGDETGYDGDFD